MTNNASPPVPLQAAGSFSHAYLSGICHPWLKNLRVKRNQFADVSVLNGYAGKPAPLTKLTSGFPEKA